MLSMHYEYRDKIILKNILIKLNQNADCTSNNVIFALICHCQHIYIGKTCNPLSIRLNLHRNHIENEIYTNQKVSKHLQDCGKKFSITIIFKASDCDRIFLNMMESYFIKLLRPELNAENYDYPFQ